MLRSSAFAAVAAGIAALGHIVGGGSPPDIPFLVAGAAAAGAVTTGLARKRRSPGTILAAMLACQVGFHLLFSIDTHGMAVVSGPADGPLRMVAFHLVAAGLSTVVLAAGERAVFGLFAALARSVRIPRPPAGIDLPPGWTARFTPLDASRPEGPLRSSSPRRGPPGLHRRPICRLALG
jgi:hypothetical protein